MWINDDLEKKYNLAIDLLDERRMKEALTQMTSMIEQCTDYQLRQELLDMQTSYQYMLKYMEQGMADPKRETVYKELLNKAYNMADLIKLSLRDDVSDSYYHKLVKKLKKHPLPKNMEAILNSLEAFNDSISMFQLTNDEAKLMKDMLAHEASLRDMFTLTLTNRRWSKTDKDIAYKYLSSEQIPYNDLALLVSAVTLSLSKCFDIEKVFWLMEAFYHKDNQVRIRAQVGFVMTINNYPNRCILYPDINVRLSLMQEEDPDFASELNATIMQLIKSQATQEISNTMQVEIVPEVMKNIQERLQQPPQDENIENGINPEWVFDMGSKLNNKLRRIEEFREEGCDINMASFSKFKHLAFFDEIQNWFMPFYPMHSEAIKTLGAKPKEMELRFLQMGEFCDSDIYSMIVMLQRLPADKRLMAYGELMSEEVQEFMEESRKEKYDTRARASEYIRKFYIQDIYRFDKVSPFASEFDSVFDNYLYMNNLEPLAQLLYQPEYIRMVADVCFKLGMYLLAHQIYDDLIKMGVEDAEIYQRMGYCFEEENGPIDSSTLKKAIEYFEKSLIIKPGNKWTLKILASCYRGLGQNEKEIACYEELVKLYPDKLIFTYKLACALMRNDQFEEALKYFYKLDLSEEQNEKAWRGISWCSFALGKTEQAQKYNDMLISSNPNANDWLNAGHFAWYNGNLQRALQCYKQANKLTDDFRVMYSNDLPMMKSKGFNDTELNLMLELV